MDSYHIVTIGEAAISVRCLTVVANQRIWCAHRNCVHVVDPVTLKIEVCSSLILQLYLCFPTTVVFNFITRMMETATDVSDVLQQLVFSPSLLIYCKTVSVIRSLNEGYTG